MKEIFFFLRVKPKNKQNKTKQKKWLNLWELAEKPLTSF